LSYTQNSMFTVWSNKLKDCPKLWQILKSFFFKYAKAPLIIFRCLGNVSRDWHIENREKKRNVQFTSTFFTERLPLRLTAMFKWMYTLCVIKPAFFMKTHFCVRSNLFCVFLTIRDHFHYFSGNEKTKVLLHGFRFHYFRFSFRTVVRFWLCTSLADTKKPVFCHLT